MTQHLIFFDDACPLCWQSVMKILAWDKAKRFYFAPLDGQAAARYLKKEMREKFQGRTLILVEDFEKEKGRIWVRGRAVLRILWLLGGAWKWLGILAYVPWGFDWAYDVVAKHRHKLLHKGEFALSEEERQRFIK